MVDIICACIYCFGMAMIAAGLQKMSDIKIKIVFPKITLEKELARRAGEHKYSIEQRLQ